MIESPNTSDYHVINLNIKKFISVIKTTIGLKANLLHNTWHNILNGSLVENKNISASIMPNMMVTIKHWAHFNYSFNFNNIQTFSEDVKKSDVNYLRHYYKLNIFPRVSTLFIINSITVISGFVPILVFISVSPNPMLT